ncbi:MAG: ATP-binding protein [Fulvivirga sp.]
MKNQLGSYHEEVLEIVEDYFLPVAYQKLDKHAEFITQYDAALKELMGNNYLNMPKNEALHSFLLYKNKVEKLVEGEFKNKTINDFDTDFGEFNKSIILFVEAIDEAIVLEQKPERFKSLPKETLILKTGKWFKRAGRNISGIPLSIANGTRKLFKKPVKARQPATHHVRLRNLSRYHFKEQLSAELANLQNLISKTISESAMLLWQVDEQITMAMDNYIGEDKDVSLALEISQKIPEALELLEKCKVELKELALESVKQQDKRFLKATERVGTFELANRNFGPSKTARVHYRLNQGYKNNQKQWDNTFVVLSDDWEIDLELYALIYCGLEAFYHNYKELEDRISKNVVSEIDGIVADVQSYKDELTSLTTSSDSAIKKALEEQLEKVKTRLEDDIIAKATDAVLAQDLPALINDIEASLNTEMQQLSEKRTLVKGANFGEPIKSSSISYIAPKELINFESWPRFKEAGKQCKVQISAKINALQQELSQLGQIAAFNLESAISLVDDKDGKNEPLDVAIEGLDRTIKKTNALKEFLSDIKHAVADDLLTSLKKLNAELEKFTDNENIFEIRVRIAKAKAIERSKRLKQEWLNKARNLLPLIWKKTISLYTKVKGLIQAIFKRYGLSKEKTAISTEIADFLAETEKSIERLPFVYQRLFQSVPLDDNNLFEGRNEEIGALNNAYNNYMKGRFAATVITGEKGCGITTLLNFFKKELTTSCKVYRFDTIELFYSSKSLLSFLSTNFEIDLKDEEAVVKYLNKGGKKIIILENIQKQFLKKVNGFDAITMLMEIISLTSKNVFWVTTCTLYAWNYLNKTIGIGDHFSYHIPMREFDDEMINKIIHKRHQVSGYNLQFEPSPSHLNNKKFKKLSEEGQQNLLREEYFNDLNKIAKSNISLGLVYWLRSTCEVSDDTIHIASLKEMDFRFMESLHLSKLHTLTYLLLHDGLREEDFSACVNKSVIRSRATLYPLFEDGILTEKNERFIVNPLLYRQTVSLLKTKNIIH